MLEQMKILVTGGAGFIGSALIRHLIKDTIHIVVNVDKLTYASSLLSLAEVERSSRYSFYHADINQREQINSIIQTERPNLIFHLAAESHVDNSIQTPAQFLETNIIGTFNLLESCRELLESVNSTFKNSFKFHHVSTDEVFGDLNPNEPSFTELHAYVPSSPYSATKASSDHLVSSWGRTYELPYVITNCSNNYGPFHHPEKFIPKLITRAITGNTLPIYGQGQNIRDWLYVEDHVRALVEIGTSEIKFNNFNIGGNAEYRNIDVVNMVCNILQELEIVKPHGIKSFSELIHHVDDRPGHDFRYAINATKCMDTFGWKPRESFESGLRKTINWYLNNTNWWNTGA